MDPLLASRDCGFGPGDTLVARRAAGHRAALRRVGRGVVRELVEGAWARLAPRKLFTAYRAERVNAEHVGPA